MRKSALALILILLLSVPGFAGTIKLSSTIGPVDAGIIPLLTETYKAKTGPTS
jgi:tungstate transport system substrate-binding protein